MTERYQIGDKVLYEEGDSSGIGTWKMEVLREEEDRYFVEVLEKIKQTGIAGVFLEPGHQFYIPKEPSKMEGGLIGRVVGLHASPKEAA